MEKAILKAIEGGWVPNGIRSSATRHFPSWIKQAALNRSKYYERYLLEPLFWQALGKAIGWENMCQSDITHPHHQENRCPVCDSTCDLSWKYHWHGFIDHIAEGKDADSFFSELLK